MSEHDLTTLLRDHLADEPPLGIASAEAIRAGRHQGRRRVAAVGATGVGVLALVAAVVVPGLAGSEGPGRAQDAPAATPEGVAVPGRLEALAASRVAPYVGDLGAPTWDVLDVDRRAVAPADPAAQYFEVGYRPDGSRIVQLHVAGFAPPEWDLYAFDSTCEASRADDFSLSCAQETLPDGSLLISSTAPYTQVTKTTKRLVTVEEARRHPEGVFWARSSSISTPEGVVAGVSEFVEADSPESADWRVPVEVLRAIATDPGLADPDAVAHEPVDGVVPE